MGAITSLIMTLLISVLVTRVASVALTLTGLSTESARFQARSAFTGCGFTTSESEQLVNHPVRRRILALLMLLGNVGLVTVGASLIVAFTSTGEADPWRLRLAALGAGLAFVLLLSTSRVVDRVMCHGIRWALRRFTDLEVEDYSSLLHLADGYRVVETDVAGGPAGQKLRRLELGGLLVLGVQHKNGPYVGAPDGETEVLTGDRLILYGDLSRLESFCSRSPEQRYPGTESTV